MVLPSALKKTLSCTFLIYTHFVNMYSILLTITAVRGRCHLALRLLLHARSRRRKKGTAVAVCLVFRELWWWFVLYSEKRIIRTISGHVLKWRKVKPLCLVYCHSGISRLTHSVDDQCFLFQPDHLRFIKGGRQGSVGAKKPHRHSNSRRCWVHHLLHTDANWQSTHTHLHTQT